jgi:signal transduction histidine kinase
LIQDTQVIVKVKDTGTGSIDPEILPQLFSKFASRSFEGTGLGLFIAKSIIVKAHDGEIWAENNNNHREKAAATFYFNLPTINTQQNVKVVVDQ